jgi:hypothetical protein
MVFSVLITENNFKNYTHNSSIILPPRGANIEMMSRNVQGQSEERLQFELRVFF